MRFSKLLGWIERPDTRMEFAELLLALVQISDGRGFGAVNVLSLRLVTGLDADTLDAVLDGLEGREFIATIRTRRPVPRIIFRLLPDEERAA